MLPYVLFFILLCLFLYDTERRLMRENFVSGHKDALKFLTLGASPFVLGIVVAFVYAMFVLSPNTPECTE